MSRVSIYLNSQNQAEEAFNFITINGFLKGKKGNISWRKHGKDENQYAEDG